jgi:hypothetical protein
MWSRVSPRTAPGLWLPREQGYQNLTLTACAAPWLLALWRIVERSREDVDPFCSFSYLAAFSRRHSPSNSCVAGARSAKKRVCIEGRQGFHVRSQVVRSRVEQLEAALMSHLKPATLDSPTTRTSSWGSRNHMWSSSCSCTAGKFHCRDFLRWWLTKAISTRTKPVLVSAATRHLRWFCRMLRNRPAGSSTRLRMRYHGFYRAHS